MSHTFSLPPQVTQALTRLHAAGFEAWIVGGCVRDLLLGGVPADYDITTSARPEETKEVFREATVLETGIRHGTVTVLLEGEALEITTYRIDGHYSDGRHPDGVIFSSNLKEDAARRDFTINAMAYAPDLGLRDYFGGQEDLEREVIRAVGDPAQRFQEDALRILRGLRFAAVLGFFLEKETETAARRYASRLQEVSAERVFQELGKLLCGPGVGRILLTYPDIFSQIIPELGPMVGFSQCSQHHCYDVYTHTAVAVGHVPPHLPLRLAMLLHDVGKPDTFSKEEDGQGHFYGHARRSVELSETILARLHTPRRLREQVLTLVRFHDVQIEETPQRVRRWLNKLGPEMFFALMAIQRGDAAGQVPAYWTRAQRVDRLEAMAREILSEGACLTIRSLSVNGEDLLALGYQGPAIGRALRCLLDEVLEGKVTNEKKELLQWLKKNDAKKAE